jgi:hypothetical protein
VIALSFDSPPVFHNLPDLAFQYAESASERLIIRHNSPLLPRWATFASSAEVLGLHPATASMLDDIRFLISTALNLPDDAPPEKLERLKKTAQWIHDRISGMPQDAPMRADAGAAADMVDPVPKTEDSDVEPHSLLPNYPKFSSDSRRPSASPGESSSTFHSKRSAVSPSDAAQPPTEVSAGDDGKGKGKAAAPKPQAEADPLYAAVRLAAPLYARAIANRSSFAEACSPMDALQILGATWRIPLARWRAVVGVFLFILAPIIATVNKFGSMAAQPPKKAEEVSQRKGAEGAPETSGSRQDSQGEQPVAEPAPSIFDAVALLAPHSGFVKSILQIGFMQIALEDWPVCSEMMGRLIGLQRWLVG